MHRLVSILTLLFPLFLVGCSSDDGVLAADAAVATEPATVPDLSTPAPDQSVAPDPYPDLGALPDLAVKEPCSSEWIDARHA